MGAQGAHVLGLLLFLTSAYADSVLLFSFSAPVGQVATATAWGGDEVHSIQPSVVRVVFLGYSELILAGPSQALGSPPCLWRLCPGPLFLHPGQLA